MHKQMLTAITLACMSTIPQLTNAQDDASKQVVISIKLCERAAESSPIKTLADSTIAPTVGQTFSMYSGGTVKPKIGEGELEIGTRVTGKLSHTGNDMMQVALKIHVGSYRENDDQTDLLLTETIELRTLLKPGVTKQFDYSQSRWCEIQIEEAEAKVAPIRKEKSVVSVQR